MTDSKFRVAILISGRGSNMVRILESRAELNAEFVGVLSSRADAPGVEKASQQFGMPVASIEPGDFDSREAYDAALKEQLDEWGANFLVLAGFMRILTKGFVEQYAGRIVNIHPSLLPAFPGLNAQQQALMAGVRISGCTVHFVGTGAVDSGPIILQRAVDVKFEDTVDSLSARIRGEEHHAYPEALRQLFAGEIRLREGRVVKGEKQ